jgi:hypothetical protein
VLIQSVAKDRFDKSDDGEKADEETRRAFDNGDKPIHRALPPGHAHASVMSSTFLLVSQSLRSWPQSFASTYEKPTARRL